MMQENTTSNKSKAMSVKDSTVEKLKDNAKKMIEKSKSDFYELGDTLIAIKAMVGHSNFSKWLDEDVDFSHNLANKYMRVVENYDKDTAIKLGIRKAYSLLKIKKEERKKFIEDHDVYKLSCSKLEELIKLNTSNDAPRINKGRSFVKNIDKFTSNLSSDIDEFVKYKLVAKDDDLSIINDNKEIFDKLVELNDLIKSVKLKNYSSIELEADATDYEYTNDGYYDYISNEYHNSSGF